MGYFRTLGNSSFKIDKCGNTIFFPWGILGKGYLLPDKKTEEKIRKFTTWYHVIGLMLILIMGAFLGLWGVLFLLIPVVLVVWYLQVKRYIKGLKQTEERLSWKDNFKKLFGNGSS
jgi:hypothetical protein